jgi:hypothetical protein
MTEKTRIRFEHEDTTLGTVESSVIPRVGDVVSPSSDWHTTWDKKHPGGLATGLYVEEVSFNYEEKSSVLVTITLVNELRAHSRASSLKARS